MENGKYIRIIPSIIGLLMLAILCGTYVYLYQKPEMVSAPKSLIKDTETLCMDLTLTCPTCSEMTCLTIEDGALFKIVDQEDVASQAKGVVMADVNQCYFCDQFIVIGFTINDKDFGVCDEHCSVINSIVEKYNERMRKILSK